jgi:methylated-DNA-[protein]-cysteine S-methyltransferase
MLDTPMGPVSVAVDNDVVRAVSLRAVGRAGAEGDPVTDLLAEAVAQLKAYFAGGRTGFDLPVRLPEGEGSDFERAVWTELRRIPYGQMRTYGQVAVAVGDAGAARAVGTACNHNPLPLIVPCHRVVGAGGKLVGFGAGLPRKRWLLEHEARFTLEQAWS